MSCTPQRDSASIILHVIRQHRGGLGNGAKRVTAAGATTWRAAGLLGSQFRSPCSDWVGPLLAMRSSIALNTSSGRTESMHRGSSNA